MIENDLPQGTLKESKYQSQKKNLKTAGICLIIAGVVVSAIVAVAIQMNGDTGKAESDNKTSAYDQLLEKERAAFTEKQATAKANADTVKAEADALIAKIDGEKQAILANYNTIPFIEISAAQRSELSKINQKYQSEIDAMTQKVQALNVLGVRFECLMPTDKCAVADPFGNIAKLNETKEFNPDADGSQQLIQLKVEAARSQIDAEVEGKKSILFTLIPAAMPLMLISGTGAILIFIAHKREVAAFHAQGMLPVYSEATGKMVKSLDDNGTLDIVAKTGAKIMGTAPKSGTKKRK